jgi:putative membrane protein
MKIVGQFVVNGLGLLATTIFIAGVNLELSLENLALTALVLTLINLILKPIIKFILHPFVVITFGLFIIVINMGLLWLIDFLFETLQFSGIMPLLWTTIILSVLNFLFIRTGNKKKVVVEKVIEKHVDSEND